MEQILSAVSHDIQEPLQLANRYAALLAQEYASRLDEDGQRMLQHLRSNTAAVQLLFDGLLEFSRLGRDRLRWEDVDLDVLCKEILDRFRLQLANLPWHDDTVFRVTRSLLDGEHPRLVQVEEFEGKGRSMTLEKPFASASVCLIELSPKGDKGP